VVADEIPVTSTNTNLSLSATAAASSTNGSDVPANAKDGSLSTHWQANTQGNGEWLRMDFGASTTLDQIVIQENNRINGVNIQYSSDGTSWNTVSGLSVVESPDKTWTANFTAIGRRYFRAVFTASGASHRVSVEEMESYNTSSGSITLDDTGEFSTSW